MMQVFDHKTKLLPLIKGIKNRIYKVPWPEIHNLQLKRFGVKQRLSFDHEGQEINIGKHLTEPEQEWLFEILRERMESNEN